MRIGIVFLGVVMLISVGSCSDLRSHEEISLSAHEEKAIEEDSRLENLRIMDRCIDDAKKIFQNKRKNS